MPDTAMMATRPLAVWVREISDAWRSSLDGIVRTGRLLIQAKEELVHGEFLSMIDGSLPFSASTAQRLMAVARWLPENAAHVQHLLPPAWGTLYELSRLPQPQFERLVAGGVVRPDMQRYEITIAAKKTRREERVRELAGRSAGRRTGARGYGRSAPALSGHPVRPALAMEAIQPRDRHGSGTGQPLPDHDPRRDQGAQHTSDARLRSVPVGHDSNAVRRAQRHDGMGV
jgi:hypothetical protein